MLVQKILVIGPSHLTENENMPNIEALTKICDGLLKVLELGGIAAFLFVLLLVALYSFRNNLEQAVFAKLSQLCICACIAGAMLYVARDLILVASAIGLIPHWNEPKKAIVKPVMAASQMKTSLGEFKASSKYKVTVDGSWSNDLNPLLPWVGYDGARDDYSSDDERRAAQANLNLPAPQFKIASLVAQIGAKKFLLKPDDDWSPPEDGEMVVYMNDAEDGNLGLLGNHGQMSVGISEK